MVIYEKLDIACSDRNIPEQTQFEVQIHLKTVGGNISVLSI
jgi:hypothetical protein